MTSDDASKQEDSVSIRAYLFIKKDTYDDQFKRTGQDERLKQIEEFINSIENSKDAMYERKKKIDGFDIIYAEGKFVEMLDEVFDNYVLGKYYATIAVASMVAERLCYDFLNFLEIKIGETILKEHQKEELHHLPFSRMIEFLLKVGILDESSRKLLNEINNIRNRHIHPKMKDAEKDALEIVNRLCSVLESRLSLFRFYDLVDGKFVKKRDTTEENLNT